MGKAADEAALEPDAEAEDVPGDDQARAEVPSPVERDARAGAPEDDLLSRLAGLAAPSALADSGDDTTEDPQVSATLSRLLGLDALRTAPTNVKPSPGVPGVPARFDAPGLSAERDDDVDSWCSESGLSSADTRRCLIRGAVPTAMCNQDASVVCLGCDGELYCTRCWNDGHLADQVPKHRAKPFVFQRGR